MAQINPDRYKWLGNRSPITHGRDDGFFWDSTDERVVFVLNDSVYQVPLHIDSQARGDIIRRGASSWERHAAATSGQALIGDGTDIESQALTGDVTITGGAVTAIGAAKVLSAMMNESLIRYTETTISAADIVSTSAGKLGHANGQEVVAAPGADKALEFVSGVLVYDYATAAYTAGGDLSINHAAGGAAVSGVVSAASSLGATADKTVLLRPVGQSLVTNAALHLVAAAAFTDPGTAVGVARLRVAYRIHDLGLD